MFCRDEFSPPATRRRQDSTMSTGSERNSLPDKSLLDDIDDGSAEGKAPFVRVFFSDMCFRV